MKINICCRFYFICHLQQKVSGLDSFKGPAFLGEVHRLFQRALCLYTCTLENILANRRVQLQVKNLRNLYALLGLAMGNR